MGGDEKIRKTYDSEDIRGSKSVDIALRKPMSYLAEANGLGYQSKFMPPETRTLSSGDYISVNGELSNPKKNREGTLPKKQTIM